MTDTWAVTPAAANTTFFFGAGAVAGAGALTLVATQPSVKGCGYKLIFTSIGDSSGMTYTVVGYTVGFPDKPTTEVVTGPNATTGLTTNYWSKITSITASAAATGNQSVGFSGALALPRTRIRGVHYVGAAAAGSIAVAMAVSSEAKLTVNTPASATFAQFVDTGSISTAGTTAADVATVTLTQVVYCTLLCG